jgi:hypothetical protein
MIVPGDRQQRGDSGAMFHELRRYADEPGALPAGAGRCFKWVTTRGRPNCLGADPEERARLKKASAGYAARLMEALSAAAHAGIRTSRG